MDECIADFSGSLCHIGRWTAGGGSVPSCPDSPRGGEASSDRVLLWQGEVQALFLRHEGYLGAIGAFLKGAEQDSESSGRGDVASQQCRAHGSKKRWRLWKWVSNLPRRCRPTALTHPLESSACMVVSVGQAGVGAGAGPGQTGAEAGAGPQQQSFLLPGGRLCVTRARNAPWRPAC